MPVLLKKKKPKAKKIPGFTQWSLQEAKAKLSQLVKNAKLGPQTICVHGKEQVVVLDILTFEKIKQKQQNFVDFLRSSPLMDIEISLERNRDPMRKLEPL
jgi:prevent-host-death family protein